VATTSPSQPQAYGSTPIPDPTVLTTEQLLREVAGVRTESVIRGDAIKELYDEKLRSVEEKFRAVYDQLALVERQRVEQKQDTKTAVDAALSAQVNAVREQTTATEKAIAKTEASTSESLKQLQATFTVGLAGQATVVSDLKERVVTIESTRITTSQFDSTLSLLRSEISSLKEENSRQQGRQQAMTAFIGIAFAVVTVALRFLPLG